MSSLIMVKTVSQGNEAFEEEVCPINYETFSDDDVEDIEMANLDDPSHRDTEEDDFEYHLKRSLPSRRVRSRHGTPEATGSGVRPEDQGYEIISMGDASEVVPREEIPKRRGSSKDAMKSAESIRRMTIRMEDKKKVKMRDQPAGGKKPRVISSWVEFKFSTSMRVRRQFQNLKQAMSSFHIWQAHMKTVQGEFGTGVLSYFIFLRWLLYLNIFICILMVCFLVVPQAIYERSYINNPQNFTGLELLTGEGWFTNTELYYGQYTPKKIHDAYTMRLAYLLIASGYILICLAILVVSIGKSYKENYIIGGESFTRFSSKVFCSWDYTISNKVTAQLKEQSIYRDILETVGLQKETANKPLHIKCKLLTLRTGTWFVTIAIMALSTWLIVYVSSFSVKGIITNPEKQSIKGMLPAITISLVNICIPPVFRMIALIEGYASSETAVNVNLFRTIVLQLTSICVYVAHLYIEIKEESVEIQSKQLCWETFIGQVFYKLVVIDFIATLLSTFLNEFIRNMLSKVCKGCREYKPGFDISKNVLNLIYGQGIVWLGTFFSPLLPLINIVKLIIIFYVKRISVTHNCKPSVKPFKASKMNVLFKLLLSIMLVFTCVVIGVVVLDEGLMKPSVNCGPFRNETRIYDVVTDTIEHHIPEWLERIIEIISSWVVISALILIMILLAYYFRLKKNTTEQKIEALKYQLTLASQDKQYLIRQIRELVKSTTQTSAPDEQACVKEKIT